MKVILLVTMVAFAAATPIDDQWASFKKKYGKSYGSMEEDRSRMAIFSQNQKMIDEHNAKYKKQLSAYYLEMNVFGDMTPAEVTLGFNRTGSIRNVPTFTFLPPANVEIPESIDWREKGAVTPVKNQGSCRSCWAFSTTGAIEGQLFRKTSKRIALSTQQLIDCSGSFGNKGCDGGNVENSFNYLGNVAGLQQENSYPYEGKVGSCRYDQKKVLPGTKVKAYNVIKAGDDASLKAAVATEGPISIAVSAGNQHFWFYKGGVFDGHTCQSSKLDHAILLVGYGKHIHIDYWLVKNSWGLDWGENGYMKLTRVKKNTCGISTYAIYPTLH